MTLLRTGLMIAATLLAANCKGDETVANYGGSANDWRLTHLDGRAFPARATLSFGEGGTISGEAPCNRYFGTQEAPYPWFSARNIGATRRACPALKQETLFLQALSEMTLSEVAGDTLILSNDAGREMLFRALPPSE